VTGRRVGRHHHIEFTESVLDGSAVEANSNVPRIDVDIIDGADVAVVNLLVVVVLDLHHLVAGCESPAELPRTGFPELFHNNAEYDAYVAAMLASGAMQDASHLWWAIRPSLKYQTLELRAPDCCTRIDDTIAIAALYRSLARFFFVNPDHNADLNVVDRAIAVENKWRAQRYGAQGIFVTSSGGIAVGELLNMVLELVTADAEVLDCSDQVDYCRTIVSAGTSADAQLHIFTENQHEGAETALHKVSCWIKDATLVA